MPSDLHADVTANVDAGGAALFAAAASCSPTVSVRAASPPQAGGASVMEALALSAVVTTRVTLFCEVTFRLPLSMTISEK